MSPIEPFGWRNGTTPDLSAEQLEAFNSHAGAYADSRVLAINAADSLKLDGVTDDGPALNTLIAAASTALGAGSQTEAVIAFPYGKTMALGTTVTRKGFVSLRGEGSHIKVLPALNAGPVFTNSTTEKFVRSDVTGFTIDKNELEGILFDCHSMQNSRIEVKRLVGGGHACTNLNMKADGTQETDGDTKSNSAFNDIELVDNGNCGYCINLEGQETTAISGGTGPAVVTLNDFHNTSSRNIYLGGCRFKEWCDNNFFTGMTSMSVKGESAYAVRMNDSATPAANVGVYANQFAYLTFEAYGTAKKRRGIVLGWSKQTVINNYFAEPLGPEGEAVENKNSQSHLINESAAEGNNLMRVYETPREIFQIAAEPAAPGAGFAKLYFQGNHLFVRFPAEAAKQVI